MALIRSKSKYTSKIITLEKRIYFIKATLAKTSFKSYHMALFSTRAYMTIGTLASIIAPISKGIL